MRVKHIDEPRNNQNPSMNLESWHRQFIKNDKYLNYECYNLKELFDLYEINQDDGSLKYVKTDFAYTIFPIQRENPRQFVYKPHDSKYLDEHLMPSKLAIKLNPKLDYLRSHKNNKNQRFLIAWKSIPSIKTIIESIINSTISKEIWFIIRGVSIVIIAYILWAIFGDSIIQNL